MPRGSAWVGLLGAVLGATAVALSPQPACACDCLPLTAGEAAAEAGVVFVGTVTQRLGEPDSDSPDPVTYVFTVEDVMKGTAGATLRVQTNNSTASCGVDFQVGRRYEVYAVDADGTPFVTQCGGTHPVVAGELSGTPPGSAAVTAPAAPSGPASSAEAIEENSHMPVEGVIAAVGIIGVLLVAIVLVSRSRRRD